MNDRRDWRATLHTLMSYVVVAHPNELSKIEILRRRQFTLRALMIVVTLAAVAFAIVGIRMRRYNEQLRLESLVRETGGASLGWSGREIRRIEFHGTSFGDEDLKPLIEPMEKAASISYLGVSSTQITDASLPGCARLTQLQSLNIAHTAISSDGLRHLAVLPVLRILSLSLTLVDDSAAPHFSKISSLERLDLSDTRITDQSIPYLAKMSHLEELDLTATDISPEGARKLKDLLPHCRIRYIPEADKILRERVLPELRQRASKSREQTPR